MFAVDDIDAAVVGLRYNTTIRVDRPRTTTENDNRE
jgi:hypothetical protein